MKVKPKKSFLTNLLHRSVHPVHGSSIAKGIHRTGTHALPDANLLVIESVKTGKVLFSANN